MKIYDNEQEFVDSITNEEVNEFDKWKREQYPHVIRSMNMDQWDNLLIGFVAGKRMNNKGERENE